MHSFTLPIHHPKPWLYSTIASLIVLGVIFALPAMASVQESIFSLLGAIVLPIISFLGSVLLMLIEILIGVFQFTEFIDTPAVQLGWVIVRDIANIAIVVALIIIAFATVFRIQKYAASQLLVRLIIAAFLVNFSLLIAGLFIDFGQVLMMTFVNQFQSLAAGNLTVGLGIEAMLKVTTGEAGVGIASGAGLLEGGTGLLAAMFLAVVLLLIAIGVILVLIVVLLQRIIYIWILSIFAPIAWVSPLLPGGSRWGGSWWSNFSKQVLIGPLLAFGFWLSMSVLAGLSAQQSLISLSVQNTNPAIRAENSAQIARFVSEVSTPQAIFDFMVTIALLLGTIWMAKSAGGVAGSFASSTFNKYASAGQKLIRAPINTADKLSGLRRLRETYQGYKSKREGIRKEGVQRAVTRLSAGRDQLTVGLPHGKRRTRAIARSHRDRASLVEANIRDAETKYNLSDLNRSQLEKIKSGGDIGRRNEAVQQAAALRLSAMSGGFRDAASLNQARSLFSAPHLSSMLNKLDDAAKKSSTDATLDSEVYRDGKGGLNAERLSQDILNGTMDVNVINNDELSDDINKAMPDAGFFKHLIEGARSGDQVESIMKKISDSTKDKLGGKTLGNYFRSQNYDATTGNYHGKYYKRNKDKIEALARGGQFLAAFNNGETASDNKQMLKFLDNKRNKNSVLDNITAVDLADEKGRAIKVLRRRATGKELERVIEDNEKAKAIRKYSEEEIKMRETDLKGRGINPGDADFAKFAYKSTDMKAARASIVKITKNAQKGYDLRRTQGREAFMGAIRKGIIKAEDYYKTGIPPTHNVPIRKHMAENLSVSQIADLARSNEDLAKEIIRMVKTLGLTDKEKSLARNYSTGHLV